MIWELTAWHLTPSQQGMIAGDSEIIMIHRLHGLAAGPFDLSE